MSKRDEITKDLEKMSREELELWIKKNNDYANEEEVFKNFYLTAKLKELLQIPNTAAGEALMSVVGKVIRIANLMKGKEPENEPIEDSVKDARVYLFIVKKLIDEERETK